VSKSLAYQIEEDRNLIQLQNWSPNLIKRLFMMRI